LKSSANESTNIFNYNDPIEVVEKRVYKLKGTEFERVENDELIISEEDVSLIKINIIIDIPADLHK
jgi:hypothetical protein